MTTTRLPIVGQQPAAPAPAKKARRPRHPKWLRVPMPGGQAYSELKKRVNELNLHTVCQSASCPNIGECWNNKALTIMILGEICTRSCRFCDVATGRPLPVDEEEPRRVATILAELELNHTVITSVDRDDLKDGGASIWAATLEACHTLAPWMTIEVLVPDFKGQLADVDAVLAANPDVFAHNLETVPRLSREVRVQARYDRSYAVLRHAREAGALTKTGIMLGLGEELDEVREVITELGQLGLTILTLGQYLQPSKKHLPVARYVHPDEFAALAEFAREAGIAHIESGPLVRSSYHAEGQAELIQRMQQLDAYGRVGFASLQ
ncbi:lipoyl synthase [Plesiocystis pacifica SIR-1]|uniref:Lipoyl synthase n=1 Tax=Plesiocystis pacifica SIR-1 TaxID=391625 RepID=A6GIK5_9BACT|nr:lipoyl synthase [Plesiocystis pacifica]EDM74291.1 lipoyl synthase [Plesiocystis pacifica SIR-1]